jgi:radical SAM superfamily enzyme YgiQ (UPF0313 family)
MPEIVLATLNAKYIHAAFGLRCLLANLGELRSRAALAEFTLDQRPLEIVEQLLAHQPRLVGFGVYIWNVRPTTEVVALLKRLRPELVVVLGGPEVSYETDTQAIVQLADHVITGEADLAFAEFCRACLADQRPAARVLPAPLPDLTRITLPYDEYDADDLAHRVVYVEASRGCPFECEFCLSSLDVPVRAFPLEPFLAALERLLERGLQHFKFVDRTFNLNRRISLAILDFFADRWRPGLFLHFEMVPDRFPADLRARVARFPAGGLQFEVGIQTYNPDVAARIHRRQDYHRLEANLRFLREQTGVHLHADLILGLPGESLESFAAGFDRLLALRPHEIQVGLLKRLRGTPIGRHDAGWGMVYSPLAPYELLENRLLDFATVQRLRRLARFWDLLANSGRFTRTVPLIWEGTPSPFHAFLACSDWLFGSLGQHHAIALPRLTAAFERYLTEVRGLAPDRVRGSLAQDAIQPVARAPGATRQRRHQTDRSRP